MNTIVAFYNRLSTPQKLVFPSLVVFFFFFVYFIYTILNIDSIKQKSIELRKQILPNYETVIYNQVLLERITFNLNNAVSAKERLWIDDTIVLMDEFEEKLSTINEPQFQNQVDLIKKRFKLYRTTALDLSYQLIENDFKANIHSQTKQVVDDYNFINTNLTILKNSISNVLQTNANSSYQSLENSIFVSVGLFLVVFIFFIFLTQYTYRSLKIKLDNLVNNFNRIANGKINFKERIQYEQEDEFAHVSLSFNNFIEKLESKHKEVVETKEDIKNFIADTVHQISSPITAIGINIGMIKFKLKDKENSKDFDSLLQQIKASISMLTNSYQDLSYITSNDIIEFPPIEISISEILGERVRFFDPMANVNNKNIIASIEENLDGFINRVELERLIDNNISNGIKYAKLGTKIGITLTKEKDKAILEFATTGKEIIEKTKVFEKNYRIDTNLKGLGWGLHMVKNICEKNKISYKVFYRDEQNIFRYVIPLLKSN